MPTLAIVGPSRDNLSVSESLVMVLQRRGREAGFCSGVVIAPKVVITAAHCVPPGSDLRIHFKDAAGASILLPIASVVRHPGYRANAVAKRERSIDLAVLTLPSALPARFRPVMLSPSGGAAVGQRFTVAGFGLQREGEPASSGRLREAELAARAPLSDVLLWAVDPARQGAGACTGDSGGPVLDAAGDVVAMMLWASGTGHHQCGALTQALWLAPYRIWIASTVGP